MHYVVGDIHGHFSEWIKLNEKIEAEDTEAIFYFVGDFIDRGPEVIETLTWAMKNITLNSRYRAVLGNHEDMIMQAWDGCVWRKFPRYGFAKIADSAGWHAEKINEVMNWLATLPLQLGFKVNGRKYVVAHGGYCLTREDTLWCRDPQEYLARAKEDNVTVIHGHTPTIVSSHSYPELHYTTLTNTGRAVTLANSMYETVKNTDEPLTMNKVDIGPELRETFKNRPVLDINVDGGCFANVNHTLLAYCCETDSEVRSE